MIKPCAVLGADVITALGVGVERNWSRMLAKDCGIRTMTRFKAEGYATAVAGELDGAEEQGLRDELEDSSSSLAYLMALGVAKRALAQGGRRGRLGLVLSTTKADIHDFEGAIVDKGYAPTGRWNPHRFTQDLAGDLGADGPVVTVSNACASGLVACIQAARLLLRGEADSIVVVGVDVLADFTLAGFSSLGALSKRPARPFDESRDGLSLGDGAAALVLALNGGSLGKIVGWGTSNDANHITGPSRTGEGLKLALDSALGMAGLAPSAVDYINAHGTGTVFNDEMEAQAVNGIFGDTPPPLTSMKGYFGHTLGAAGLIELVLSLKAIQEKTVPPSLGFETLGVTKTLDVPQAPRRLADFNTIVTMKAGFGGVNAVIAAQGGGTA